MLCEHCNVPGIVYRQTNGNGAFVIVERCPKCRRNTRPGQPFLSKKGIENIDALPMFVDFMEQSEPCSVFGCERKDTEYHHFAPRHLFEDAEDWPGAYLCKYHHMLWHKLTMTGMYAPQREKVTV